MPMLERPEGAIHYEVCDVRAALGGAARETILFLHGLAIDSDIWVTWLPALADRYRIVRVDLRGFGRSFVPAAGESWTMEALAGDVRDVLAALEVERVHFVRRVDGRHGRPAACGAPPREPADAHHGHGGAPGRHHRQIAGVERRRAEAGDGRVVGEAHAPPLPRRVPEPRHGALVPRHAACRRASRLRRPRRHAGSGGPHRQRLGDINVPTLLIAPERQPIRLARDAGVERLRAMPDCEMHVVAGARTRRRPFTRTRMCRALSDDSLSGADRRPVSARAGRRRSPCRCGRGWRQARSRPGNRTDIPMLRHSSPWRAASSRNCEKWGAGSSAAGGIHMSPTTGSAPDRPCSARPAHPGSRASTPAFCGSAPVLTWMKQAGRRP